MIEIITRFAASCDGGGFFGFPTWYKYLGGQADSQGKCTPIIGGINDIWLVVAAVIEILLRIAAMAAVIIIIYAGVQYVTSQDSPETTKQARSTIINALIGLALAVMAAVIIEFIAKGIG